MHVCQSQIWSAPLIKAIVVWSLITSNGEKYENIEEKTIEEKNNLWEEQSQ